MEEPEGKTVVRINILQTSMTLGTYLGAYKVLVYLTLALTIVHSTALSLLSIPLMLGVPVMAFFLIYRFRNSTKSPFFPFPVSWMLSILMFLFATVLSCVIAYLYLQYIDNGALASGIMKVTEETVSTLSSMSGTLTDPSQAEMYRNNIELFRQAADQFCSLSALGVAKQLIQTSLMWGIIFALIIGLITAKRLRIN